MYKYKVLMTSVGGSLGAKNIKAMKASYPDEVWVLGVDINHNHNAQSLADKFITVPSGDSSNYIDKICNAIKKYNINRVLPCSDEEAISLSKNKEIIENLGAKLLTAKDSTIKIMSNKISTYKFLKENNIDVPYYKELSDYVQLDHYVEEFYKNYGSFVIKEPEARGNRGTVLVDQKINGLVDYMGSREIHAGLSYYKNNIRPNLDNNFPKIITERLYAPAYDIDILAKNGNIIHAVPRERINPAGVPYKGNIIRNNQSLIKLATQVAKALNLSYLYDLDVMTKKDGTPVILEVNPRPSGSCVASMECGIPLYKDLLRLPDTNNFNKVKTPKDGTIILPIVDCNIILPN